MSLPNHDEQVREAREIFESHRERFSSRARWIGRRQGLPEADLDDFVSDVMLKLIDEDYAVLRAFKGRGDVLSFVSSVILHLAQDERNRRWGKWRPSAEAKRRGATAIQLEIFLYRDQLGFEETSRRMRERFPRVTQEEIDTLASQLPNRTNRRFETDDEIATLPAAAQADESVVASQRDAGKVAVLEALDLALKRLDPEWRLALIWFYSRGWKAKRIAQGLQIETKRVYRIFEHAKRRLRKDLEDQGLGAEEALANVGWDLDPRAAPRPLADEIDRTKPST